MPKTLTGIALEVVRLLPSWPEELSPQHWTVPFASRAQACELLAETAMAVVMPETRTGLALLAVLILPSWPEELFPQHWTVPFANTPHVNELPVDMLIISELVPSS